MEVLLKIEGLKFSWPGAKSPLLEIDSLEVKPRERVFLQGPSGSGKSTLLNLIGGVLCPQGGKIETLGIDITRLSSGARDQFRGDHMGFIFQMFNLLPYFSAVENVTLPCKFSKKKSERVLKNSPSVEEEATRLLMGLDLNPETLSKKSVRQLSVGQQQRVAVARALMGRPELIIADEPTSALDAGTRDGFLKLLFGECEKSGTALVFVSHDQGLGEKFDRMLSLGDINK